MSESTDLTAVQAGDNQVSLPSTNRALPQPEVVKTRFGMFGASLGEDTTGFSGLVQKFALPGETERPYGSWFDEVVDIIEELIESDGLKVADVIERVVVQHDQLTLWIRREHLPRVAQWLRDDQDLRFEMCLGVTGVNYPEDEGRELHGYYAFRSFTHKRTIFIESTCPDADPHLPSLAHIYPGIDWHEREAWDLMGIVFDGHPALTRIALPQEWVGHPQRKDYPLGGIPVQYRGATTPPADSRRSYN